MVKHRAGVFESPWLKCTPPLQAALRSGTNLHLWLPLQKHAAILGGLKVPYYNHFQTFFYFGGGWKAVIITMILHWQTRTHILGKGNNVGPLSLLQSMTSRGYSGPIQSAGSSFEVVWVEHRGEAPCRGNRRRVFSLAGDLRTAAAGRLVNLSVQLFQSHGDQRKNTRVNSVFLYVCFPLHIFESSRSSATVAGLHPHKKNKTKKKCNITWSVRDTDLTEHRKINVCTSATLPLAEVKNGTAMEEFHIQVENKQRHPMLASPPRTPLRTHRWNTLTCTILVASHVTLYIQV